ncbi:MAG TPA: hypothetical protein VNA88_19450 [Candidatus Kapabacteria bacterium]|jgi:hypothetical protein|nr:hypothetical protein [Candidatus Kapabacteria bacterium]
MPALEYLWDEIELAVCRVCVDHTSAGCRSADAGRCALKNRFRNVVEAIASTTSATYPPYVAALRSQVCTVCEFQHEAGRCSRRDNVDCALDRYYPLVIDAVEEALYGNPISMTMARR